MGQTTPEDLDKSALRGEPSHVWRAGQERRLDMILKAAGHRLDGRVLVDGCGVGMYVNHLLPHASQVFGLDIELPRIRETFAYTPNVVNSVGENLPFANDSFELVLSHEVLEHVRDDAATIREIVRVLKPGGRLVLFCPNRGYPFETHGIYTRGRYHFGNIPLINYLPMPLRNKLAPHVRVYTQANLRRLFQGLPVKIIEKRIIFGAYDNIIHKKPKLGRFLRAFLYAVEKTPLQKFGLSHFWVVEKTH